MKTIAAVAIGLLLVVGAYDQFGTRRLAERVDELELERTRLVDYAERLCASRRVAQVEVTEQCLDDEGQVVSRLRWQEVEADGLVGRPVEVETVGYLGYFEAYVVKFEHKFVGQGDPERGVSVCLFRRVFGDQQAPESVALLESGPPAVASGETPPPSDAGLWQRFWDLIENSELRERFGVRVAQIEAPAVPLHEGQVWEITLDAAGGLNVKLAHAGQNFIPPWCGDAAASIAHRVP